MSETFHIKTPGKWVLAGEHAVLRGYPALAFPLTAKNIELFYEESDDEIRVDFSGETGKELQLLFWSVLEKGLEFVNHPFGEIRGKFQIHSNVPMGVGLGGSASLCVAIASWFAWKQWIPSETIPEFARTLENLFHGESSGMDISAVLSKSGIRFTRNQSPEPLALHWQPHWYLSSSGQLGMTAHCVDRVKSLLKNNPALGKKIDLAMQESVILCENALKNTEQKGLPDLAKGIQLANDCFRQWDLLSDNLLHHMNALETSGAIAVKPTGSGSGGFVLSLWKEPPPKQEWERLLISCQ